MAIGCCPGTPLEVCSLAKPRARILAHSRLVARRWLCPGDGRVPMSGSQQVAARCDMEWRNSCSSCTGYIPAMWSSRACRVRLLSERHCIPSLGGQTLVVERCRRRAPVIGKISAPSKCPGVPRWGPPVRCYRSAVSRRLVWGSQDRSNDYRVTSRRRM